MDGFGRLDLGVDVELGVNTVDDVQVDRVYAVVLGAAWLPACYRRHVRHLLLGFLVVL